MSNEFRDVLGGILSALAEGRHLSDNVSKQLSTRYEQDDLLRAFPVPRVELENVELELKFAVTSQPTAPAAVSAPTLQRKMVGGRPVPALTAMGTVDPAAVDRLISNTALNTANVVTNSITDLTSGSQYGIAPSVSLQAEEPYPDPGGPLPPDPSPIYTYPDYDLSRIHTTVRDVVLAAIAEPTRVACATAPQQGVNLETYNAWSLADRILRELVNLNLIQFYNGTSMPQVTEQLANFVLPSVKQTHDNEVTRLRSALSEVTPTPTDPTGPLPPGEVDEDDPAPDPTEPAPPEPRAMSIGIVTRYQDLMLMKPEVISTLKLSINVKNYEWTKIDEQDGQAVRRLVQE